MRLISKILHLTKEGLLNIFTHGFMSFASVSVIMACLIIMGCFALLSVNINSALRQAESEYEMVGFIDENLSDEEAKALQSQVEAIENVHEVQFITRETAWSEFVAKYPNQEQFQDLDADILRHRFSITMDDITQMALTQRYVLLIRGIVKVNASAEIAKGFYTVRNVVNAVSAALAAILVTVSVFIMANTIKLTTFGRRDEIAIMKMVGATNSFIRWPFIVEGVALGLMGSILAFLLLWGIYGLVADRLSGSAVANFLMLVPFSGVVKYQFLAVFMGIGLAVGAFGGVVAIRNYLKV